MKKPWAIVSGGRFSPLADIEKCGYIIACDRGYEYLHEAGLRPDLLVGDFDSYTGPLPQDVPRLDLRMEAELLSGVTVTDEASLYRAADTLLAAGLQRVFISLGADGVLAADHERKVHLHNLPARMVNTTGCGDAFMAAVARAFLDGADLETAARRGLAASAIAMESADTINPAMSLTAVAERIQ